MGTGASKNCWGYMPVELRWSQRRPHGRPVSILVATEAKGHGGGRPCHVMWAWSLDSFKSASSESLLTDICTSLHDDKELLLEYKRIPMTVLIRSVLLAPLSHR